MTAANAGLNGRYWLTEKGWAAVERDKGEVAFVVGPTGIVHDATCRLVTEHSNHWEWAPKLRIGTDRAHGECLPEGLPS